MSPAASRNIRPPPLAWRIAGSVDLLLGLVVTIASLSRISDILRLGFVFVIALGLVAVGGGLLTGRVWAYWPSVAALALFALFLGGQAIEERQPSTSVVAGLVLATLVGLLLPPSWRARVRAERREDREALTSGWMTPDRTRMLLTLSSAAFASLGAVMIVAGERDDRPLALMITLFGLAGLIVFTATKPSSRAVTPPKTGTLVHKGAIRPALVFRLHRGRGLAMSLAAAAFAGSSALLAIYAAELSDPGESSVLIRVVGAVGAVFFGLAALAWGWSAGGSYVAFLPEGILVRSGLGRAFVPWETMKRVAVIDYWGQAMLGINVSDQRQVQMPGWGRVLGALNRRLTGWDLSFPVGVYGFPPAVLEITATHYLEHQEARGRIGSELPPGLTETSEDS